MQQPDGMAESQLPDIPGYRLRLFVEEMVMYTLCTLYVLCRLVCNLLGTDPTVGSCIRSCKYDKVSQLSQFHMHNCCINWSRQELVRIKIQ